VALSKLLATIMEIYRMTDNRHGIEFVLHDELPPGAVVRGRDERLGQVFRNLIDNAVSFSPEQGKVTVTASRHDIVARITVEDEGPGIPPGNLESITPSGRAKASDAIPGWGFPSPARSSKARAGAFMRRIAPPIINRAEERG
jgi:signal transduction histidine kinase